ncbi:KTSC domain-containing protein [Brevundimonas sp.]|uniref:KTSC domain-containing protein n=1 Tax=Brevundimonas sp. TaxID=1871086 RepID=UPI00286AF4C7|nr:KTSC domain-containing protein [Brevundimonas sp.]
MPSSVIRWFRYNEAARTLRVGFVSGETYEYDEVPPEAAAGLKAAPSRGRFFGPNVRDRYPYRRVTDGSAHPSLPVHPGLRRGPDHS